MTAFQILFTDLIKSRPLIFLSLSQGCQTDFHGGPHQPHGAFKGPNVILGLYKCNYSLTVKRELGAASR